MEEVKALSSIADMISRLSGPGLQYLETFILPQERHRRSPQPRQPAPHRQADIGRTLYELTAKDQEA